MVSSILNNAVSGLRLTQTLIGTTTRNISNSGTEGYTRKVQQAVTGPAGGVMAGEVRRATDDLMVAQLRTYSAARANAETTAEALDRIDRLAGDPTRTDSLSGRVSALADSLQQIATDPTGTSGYGEAIGQARALAETFRNTYVELESIGREAAKQIPGDIAEVNGMLDRVASINRQVAATGALGRDDSDLLDQRDQIVTQLSETMNVRGFVDQRNVLHLYTADNKLLADEGAYPLVADPSGNVTAGGQPAYRIGGRIGARQDIAGQVVPTLQRQIDDLAAQLTQGLAAAGVPLFNDGGATDFDPTQVAGYGGRIAVSTAFSSDPTLLRGGSAVAVGDTRLVVAARQALVGDEQAFGAPGLPARATLTTAAAAFVGNVSSRTSTARDDVEGRQVAEDLVRARLSEVSDVSIDQEMAYMVELQTAYAANARVLQTAQTMMDELLNLAR